MKKFLFLLTMLAAIAGLMIAITRLRTRQQEAYGDEDSDTFDLVFAFEGMEFESHARALAGGSALVVCSGVEIDLRYAQLDPMGAYLEIDCWFAGVDIIVPDNWRVILNARTYAGGAENTTEESAALLPEDAPTLEIDARIGLAGLSVRPVAALEENESSAPAPAPV